ncbi:putative CocE/NonD family hydrolase [Chitinophaga terrae (ex Kim and Jung 2007)]|uniref:CocE/NonD family hydrolase n=1 Tax=Chitinophaga terrae (ex Kim and Jung 2007) TaxID=408074 RepID=UPI002781884A|nr:CocE/NonD family hydrolase [Chitinophaga terrae (ex Kim and Jung 2007)]MDQ0106267.1 putative CocE/NonD family hydrolase [Chitinophaga terrae (ex Kim and Jung 2007)]
MKRMTKVLLGVLLTLPARALFAQDSAWVTANYVKQEEQIVMRDGVKLFTSIYRPKDTIQRRPVLLTRTPYSAGPYGEAYTSNLWKTYWSEYTKLGYILVIQDVRGRWMSEGQFEDVRPFNPKKKGKETDEASDTYDTIDWLVNHVPGNNGRVGVFGISYPGFYTTMAALSGHPALKAVSPQAPVTDWFMGDDFHHNGAFCLMDCFSFYTKGFGYPHPAPIAVAPAQQLQLPCNDNYQAFLDIGAIPNFTKLTGDSLAFWKKMMQHPDYDKWWQQRNARNYVENLQPAVLVVGGLFDAEDCFGAWNLYQAIEKKNPAGFFNKIVMGPWYHGQWASNDGSRLGHIQFGGNTAAWYQQHIEIPFFNYYLLGKGDLSGIAEATIFFTGENQWRQFPKWPPAAVPQTYYLQQGGSLAVTPPAGGKSTYVSDPAHPVPYTEDVHFYRTRDYMTDDQRFASRRPDVLTFKTGVLTEDITVAGAITADLRVSITGTDADFIVKVIDVMPDDFRYDNTPPPNKTRDAGGPYPLGGYQMLVRGEVMRGRYRNSFQQPEAFRPNEITTVRFQLPDIAHTFRKGHRIMVQIQSTWFPLIDRNPQQFVDIYRATDEDFIPQTVNIHHDARNASAIVLPVLK